MSEINSFGNLFFATIGKALVLILSVLALSGCQVNKKPQLIESNKGNNLVRMGYSFTPMERPNAKWDDALAVANNQCNSWGLGQASVPKSGETSCIEAGTNGSCAKYVTYADFICSAGSGSSAKRMLREFPSYWTKEQLEAANSGKCEGRIDGSMCHVCERTGKWNLVFCDKVAETGNYYFPNKYDEYGYAKPDVTSSQPINQAEIDKKMKDIEKDPSVQLLRMFQKECKPYKAAKQRCSYAPHFEQCMEPWRQSKIICDSI